jgi:2-amino-4-hydroxy-6-hydroxymethyldihydropteridine diphosphokinase
VAVAYLGLGTNIGDRGANLRRAVREIGRCARVFATSRVYATAPVGYAEQEPFWNMVVRVSTALAPRDLIAALKNIETRMGRVATFINGPRLIDIDILLYDDITVDDGDLVIPHPRAMNRAFVLRPLAELSPDLVEPKSGRRIRDFLDDVATQVAEPLDAALESA